MIDASWLVFAVASLVLIATPGQGMILVMSRSVAQGAAAGVATAGGVSVGLVVHTVMATLGLGAILRTSEWLFVALKLVGAGSLVYLGFGLLRTRQSRLPILVKAPVGIFAGRLSAWLRSRPGVLAWAFHSSGAILVALGVRLALERR